MAVGDKSLLNANSNCKYKCKCAHSCQIHVWPVAVDGIIVPPIGSSTNLQLGRPTF